MQNIYNNKLYKALSITLYEAEVTMIDKHRHWQRNAFITKTKTCVITTLLALELHF